MISKELQKIFDSYDVYTDEMYIDKLFDYASNHNISDDDLMKMFDEYLDKKYPKSKMKKMQTGGGISNTIGWSKRPNYKVVLQNYY